MKLEDYLEAVRICPDDKLRDERGVYDNYKIYLQGNFDDVVT